MAPNGWVRLLRERRPFPTAQDLIGYLSSQVLAEYEAVLPAAAVPAFPRVANGRALAELRRADGSYDLDFVRLDLLAITR